MTDASSDEILVLYGSQTGNAQAIAEKLNERLLQENFNVTLKVLNHYDKLSAPITEQQLVAVRHEEAHGAVAAPVLATGYSGRPSTRFAMMLAWISLLPP